MTAPEQAVALVVNDDPSQLRLTMAVLEKANTHARCFLSAEEALAALRRDSRVDIVITDIHMPGIDGWELCRLLRSREYAAFNRTPILVLSATFPSRDAEELSIEVGANGFLAAPYAPSELQSHVRALLEGRKPRRLVDALLISGNSFIVQAVERELRAGGDYNLRTAGDGPQGRQVCHAYPPDVVLLDGGLPAGDKIAVLEELSHFGSRIVTIVVSAADDNGSAAVPSPSGVHGRVAVPFAPGELTTLCEKIQRRQSVLHVEEMLEQRTRALRDSEGRWRALLEGIPEAVLLYDEDGIIHHINRLGAERLEAAPTDVIGRNIREFEPERPAARERSPSDELHNYETRYVSTSGREINVDVTERGIQFDGKRFILSVARDVTASKELARQRANFLAMLTHDIKNPLAVIMGFAGMLPEVGELNAEQREIVMRMQSNAQTVLALVANYLDFSKIESGSLTLTERPIALNELLRRVADQYSDDAQRRRVQLSVQLSENVPAVMGDELALERAFHNVIHNALKFTPEDGRVDIESSLQDDHVTVVVSDTGCGISSEDLPTLFQPYRRGTVRPPKEGTGLGLYITKTMVEAHGGFVTVDSAQGRGSRFAIHLPVRAPTAR